jgi:16S rRNA (guanine527-N7)-methyltransferase
MEKLVREAQEVFNVNTTGRQMVALMTYEKELMEWNQKFNLTAIRDSESIRTKHFLDSFSCVMAWRANPPNSLIDVGTGAGFPGSAQNSVPNLKLTLLIRRQSHVLPASSACWDWLRGSRQSVPGMWGGIGSAQQYDWAVGRAVANLNILASTFCRC